MKEYVVNSLEVFLSSQYGFPETDFFRGHPSSDYKLIPSIGIFFKL